MLIKNGTLYTENGFVKADIEIENGKVKQIAESIKGNADIDAEGLIISPGFIDLHVHFREPGFEYKETIESGSTAAAKGGFTTVCAMPNLNPTPDTLEELQKQLENIEKTAKVNVLPFGCITVGEKGEKLAEIEGMAPYCVGFSDDGKGVQSDELMRYAMQEVKKTGSFISEHCEVESLLNGGYVHEGEWAKANGHKGISSASEYVEVRRNVELAKETGCRFHVCHVSTWESLEAVRQGKKEGLPVTCEVTPHHILQIDEDIIEDNGRFKMNPPLRTKADRDAILKALQDGTIDAIATDHAPHSAEEKSKGLAGSAMGVVGLETAFGVLNKGLVEEKEFPLEKLLYLLTFGPAKVLEKEYGLKVGAPADIVVLDAQKEWIVQGENFVSKGKVSSFENYPAKGEVKYTLVSGEFAYKGETE
jgi:dihydroorotase, multifunctional complex type